MAASCRIFNALPTGATNVGSGTLVDVAEDRRSGLILTCAHLFSEGTGQLTARFADGAQHGAILVAIDRQADLAAIEIAGPRVAAVPLAAAISHDEPLHPCGFGGDGVFRSFAGRVLGQASGHGQESIRIAGAVRSGDSGGGVFNSRGELVAVVWGECGGVTYASTGAPLRRFVDGLLGRRRPAPSAAACPDGRCPLAPPASSPGVIGWAPAAKKPVTPPRSSSGGQPPAQPAACDCGCRQELAALGNQLQALHRDKLDVGDFLRRDDLNSFASRDEVAQLEARSRERHQGLLDQIAKLPTTLGPSQTLSGLALTALGISGPTGWAIIAAASVGSWLLGRKARAKRREGRDLRPEQQENYQNLKPHHSSLKPHRSGLTPPPEATAAAADPFLEACEREISIDEQAPIERDDREARELLRLSQLEGRDPLQDALAGRLALDRLDAVAESDADPQQARWADDLRRQLRERFNEIAPTKFQVKG